MTEGQILSIMEILYLKMLFVHVKFGNPFLSHTFFFPFLTNINLGSKPEIIKSFREVFFLIIISLK